MRVAKHLLDKFMQCFLAGLQRGYINLATRAEKKKNTKGTYIDELGIKVVAQNSFGREFKLFFGKGFL